MPRESGDLHDCRIPPDKQCPGLVKPMPSTSGGSKTFAKPPASPVSHEDDNLLTGGDAVGVEAGLAHLTVSSPRGPDGKGEEASISEALPPLVEQ